MSNNGICKRAPEVVDRPTQPNAMDVRAMLSERGSLNPARGYKPDNQADIFLENCGTCYLLQPRSAKGQMLVQKLLADTMHLFFGNDLVLRRREAMLLIAAAERHGIKIRIANYCDGQ